MTQQVNAKGLSGRALAMARRKAMSGAGKEALSPSGSSATSTSAVPPAPPAIDAATPAARAKPRARTRTVPANSSRSSSLARRKALSSRGKVAVENKDRTRNANMKNKPAPVARNEASPVAQGKSCGCGCKDKPADAPSKPAGMSGRSSTRSTPRPRRNNAKLNQSRAVSLARRQAQSSRGKAGLSASGMSAAQTARATNPGLSGRELARALRSQRSVRGSAGMKKAAPSGRQRPNRNASKGPAQDQPWKVGASETSHGQTVTGTQVGRSNPVTGDEASTCRTVTGTEYMGADIFRSFCQAEPSKGTVRSGQTTTAQGSPVTGNKVSRSSKVTGNEPGTCKNVTGTEYVSAEQAEAYCGEKPQPRPTKGGSSETRKGKAVTGNQVGRSKRVTGDETGADRQLTGTQYTQIGDAGAPAKVGSSATLRGGSVTGTLVGRREKMTGDEPGSCTHITGDDYVGKEQYQKFCQTEPKPSDRKVGASHTLSGETVTGTMTGRSTRVTGDEPGTCKAITGTPYAGAEQYSDYCDSEQVRTATARMPLSRREAGAPMTGIQPSVGGKMSGDARGACETVSGTPYLGSDQQGEVCAALPADMGSPDFPQPLGETPWGAFSVTPPVHAASAAPVKGMVTGTGYEQGQITGPFGMATGKVTGTEEARFGRSAAPASHNEPLPEVAGRVKSRITGEGIDAGSKITGDDWERGDRVTGTEGTSAKGRNPTRRGGQMNNMMTPRAESRSDDLPTPVSKVTGGSGNTERGALVTYSGGARG
ncbi:MAG: CsoS2 family carboxysome shell protein [Candidatus Thiodiazotropha sp.]